MAREGDPEWYPPDDIIQRIEDAEYDLFRSTDVAARVKAGDPIARSLVMLSRWAMRHQPPMGSADRAWCGDWAVIKLPDDK